MTFSTLVRSRLAALGYGQKDLAQAARVTDSYVSQLLTRRKSPPAPDRTDIYRKMEVLLQLKPGELERLVESERTEELKRKLAEPPEPLFHGFRELLLRKCTTAKRAEVRRTFEGQPFGTLEHIVARSLLDVVQGVARRRLDSEDWLRRAARAGGRTIEQMRVIVLDFLDAEIVDVSSENCAAFLDPLVESWDVDLDSLRLDILLNQELVDEPRRTLAFIEQSAIEAGGDPEPGFAEFLDDPALGGDVTQQEIDFLRAQRFGGRRPRKLYYYRALQNLRDPLHFEGD